MVYVDDTLNFSKTVKDILVLLNKVLAKQVDAGVTVRRLKYSFA